MLMLRQASVVCHLFDVSVDVDQVKREDVILRSNK